MKPSKLVDNLRRCYHDKKDKYLKYFQILKDKRQERPTVDSEFASTPERDDDSCMRLTIPSYL